MMLHEDTTFRAIFDLQVFNNYSAFRALIEIKILGSPCEKSLSSSYDSHHSPMKEIERFLSSNIYTW